MKLWKIIPLILTALIALALISCDLSAYIPTPPGSSDGEGTTSHTCVYGLWQVTKEPSCEANGERMRTCIVCDGVSVEQIDATGHTPQTVAATASTCTVQGNSTWQRCARCHKELTAPTDLPLAPHTEVTIPATSEKTEGKKCTVCNTVTVSPTWIFSSSLTTPESYDGSYGYNYLSTLPKGASLTAFYDRIDKVADAYHLGDLAADGDNVISAIAFSDLGLTDDEAIAVWVAYRCDRPLYYWISTRVSWIEGKSLNLVTFPEYKSADYRRALNSRIYEAAETYLDGVSAAEDTYEISLLLHNAIILNTDYAYESDGVTPEDDQWAHSIVGVVEKGLGVCEAYSEMFQLMLNLCDVENVYVTGYSRGVGHAWNMVKMDDGAWYWFDLTWDDTPTHDRPVSYNYFCVSSSEWVGWQDGAYVETGETFLSGHTPDTPGYMGMDFAYALPTAAGSAFSASDILIKSLFTVSGFTYSVCGPREVQVVWIDKSGDVSVPDTVVCNGVTFAVTGIGALKSEGGKAYTIGAVADGNINSITLGKNINLIWNFAFNIASLKSVSVSADNENYVSLDGIIYETEGEIVWIPKGLRGDIEIYSAATALEAYRNGNITFNNCYYITSITLHKGIEEIPAAAFSGCNSLDKIYFLGTVAQWNALSKGTAWSGGRTLTVYCTDGTVVAR